MTRLALIRHGHTAWNRSGRIQGRSDIPLDDAARKQLANLQLPCRWRDANLISSPLARAVETAELISGRTPFVEPALIEMDWGRWEGERGADLLEDPAQDYRHIDTWGWSYRPPGGESPDDLRRRLAPWWRGLKAKTVAVCHIGIMRVLLAEASGWAFSGPAPFRIKRNRLYVLRVNGDAIRLEGEPLRLEERA